MPLIHVVKTEPIATNTVIISEGGKAAIFDPSGEASVIIDMLSREGLEPVGIWITHGHWDHTMAVRDLVEKYGIDWYLSEADEEMFAAQPRWIPEFPVPARAALPFAEGVQKIAFLDAEVIATPGHTPGGVCVYFPDLGLLLGGDTLFADTIGRTDLYLSDNIAMLASLEKLKSRGFPDDTLLVPGHGRNERIAEVRRRNPFFK